MCITARFACIRVSACVMPAHKQPKLEVIVLYPFDLNSLYFLLKLLFTITLFHRIFALLWLPMHPASVVMVSRGIVIRCCVYFTQPHLPLLLFLEFRWEKANQTATQRQSELETCADRLGNFASAANQLGPWLREKELMMSVLGPLSIDPNMLNTQKQQVQVYSGEHSRVQMSALYLELNVELICGCTLQ